MKNLSCTIVLPCYNPQEGWEERVVKSYLTLSQSLEAPIQLVLVNDGSTKGVDDFKIEYIRKNLAFFQYISYDENKGKGAALRAGVQIAQNDLIIYTDIDFPYTTDSILKIYKQLKDGSELAVGIKDENYYANVPIVRRYISRILRSMIGLFFNLPVTDTQCGLKGFSGEVKQIFLNTEISRYLFDLEFIRAVHKKGFSVKSVPVKLNENVVFRRMNYKILLPELVNFMSIILRRK